MVSLHLNRLSYLHLCLCEFDEVTALFKNASPFFYLRKRQETPAAKRKAQLRKQKKIKGLISRSCHPLFRICYLLPLISVPIPPLVPYSPPLLYRLPLPLAFPHFPSQSTTTIVEVRIFSIGYTPNFLLLCG